MHFLHTIKFLMSGYNKNMMENFNSIDAFKWIMAILVVAIHTQPFILCTNRGFMGLYNNLIELAVPFFFVSSGYLLFRKFDKDLCTQGNFERIKYSIVRYLKIYLVWTAIYLPVTIFGYYQDNTGFLYSVLHFLRGLLITGSNYYSWSLWYLLSTVYALATIYILMKLGRYEKSIATISVMVLLVAGGISFISENMVDTNGNITQFIKAVFSDGKVFSGLGYISCGFIIARYKISLPRLITLPAIVICMIGKAQFGFPFSIFSSLLLSIMFFLFVIKINLPNNCIWISIRKSSTIIFLTHMYFFFIYTLLFKKQIYYYGLDAFLVTVTCSCLMSIIVVKLEKRYNWINKLF